MMSKNYKRTTELNDIKSASTGSCTAFYGKNPWKEFKSPYMFFEVADCHSKTRLHNSQTDSRKTFIPLLIISSSIFKNFPNTVSNSV